MRILLYCDFALPDSCADATRVINLAKLLRDSGHDVTLLGVQYRVDGITEGSYDGIPFEMLRAEQWYGFQAPKRIRALERDISEYLSTHTGEHSFDAIILSGNSIFYKSNLSTHTDKICIIFIIPLKCIYDQFCSNFF